MNPVERATGLPATPVCVLLSKAYFLWLHKKSDFVWSWRFTAALCIQGVNERFHVSTENAQRVELGQWKGPSANSSIYEQLCSAAD